MIANARSRRFRLTPGSTNKGATLVEYGMLAGLISVVTIAAVVSQGEHLHAMFSKSADKMNKVQLVATADLVHTLPDSSIFPAQHCWEGTAGNDTLSSGGGGIGDTADCIKGNGGTDTISISSGPARDLLVALGNGSATIDLPGGSHWLVAPTAAPSGSTTAISFVSGTSLIDLRPFTKSQVSVKPSSSSSSTLLLTFPNGGEVKLGGQFPDAHVTRFIYVNGEIDASAMHDLAISSQESEGVDTVNGSAAADYISSLGSDDTILPFEGDDTIVYSSGRDLILGDNNTGFDTLDLSKYSSSEVSFAQDWGTAVRIDTPDGFVRLTQQLSYPVGDPNTNIEQVIFSDKTLTDAQMRALLP